MRKRRIRSRSAALLMISTACLRYLYRRLREPEFPEQKYIVLMEPAFSAGKPVKPQYPRISPSSDRVWGYPEYASYFMDP